MYGCSQWLYATLFFLVYWVRIYIQVICVYIGCIHVHLSHRTYSFSQYSKYFSVRNFFLSVRCNGCFFSTSQFFIRLEMSFILRFCERMYVCVAMKSTKQNVSFLFLFREHLTNRRLYSPKVFKCWSYEKNRQLGEIAQNNKEFVTNEQWIVAFFVFCFHFLFAFYFHCPRVVWCYIKTKWKVFMENFTEKMLCKEEKKKTVFTAWYICKTRPFFVG